MRRRTGDKVGQWHVLKLMIASPDGVVDPERKRSNANAGYSVIRWIMTRLFDLRRS
jgi:hypothetical protein